VSRTPTTYLLGRIEVLTETLKSAESPWNEEDLEDVAREALEFLRDALDIPRLEKELAARSRIDRETLTEVTDWFAAVEAEVPPAFGMTFPDGTSFDWSGRMQRLRELLGGLVQAEGLEEFEVVLRLSLVGDPCFASMLMALAPDHAVRARLELKLREKLSLLPDDQALGLWAGLRAEVDPSAEVHIAIDPSVVSPDFFDLGDAGTARDKIATYLAKVRPLLVRKTFEGGSTHIPAGQTGIATILSWTAVPSTRAWATTDRVIIRALGRIALCWPGSKTDLAEVLGVQPDGYFVGGRAPQEAKRSLGVLGNKNPTPTRILVDLATLLRIAEQRAIQQVAPVERALRAYKLGLEVMAQDVRDDLASKDELRLQREMCRFLVERDVRAYGTKFGWSEVDVRADDSLGAVVIEAKLLKKPPSERDINRWLTQLGSYMDQEHLALRGVLVLYNFSDAAILCPVETIRFRFLLLAINLCPASPSKRTASIEVQPTASGEEVIRVHRLGEVTAKRRRSKKGSTPKKNNARKGRGSRRGGKPRP